MSAKNTEKRMNKKNWTIIGFMMYLAGIIVISLLGIARFGGINEINPSKEYRIAFFLDADLQSEYERKFSFIWTTDDFLVNYAGHMGSELEYQYSNGVYNYRANSGPSGQNTVNATYMGYERLYTNIVLNSSSIRETAVTYSQLFSIQTDLENGTTKVYRTYYIGLIYQTDDDPRVDWYDLEISYDITHATLWHDRIIPNREDGKLCLDIEIELDFLNAEVIVEEY